jgi:alpha-methylacyl-CoA racemase
VTGPLEGLRVLELGAIGPSAHAAMVLGDLGADVVRVDRRMAAPTPEMRLTGDVLRSRRSVCLDLKDPGDLETLRRMVDRADVLLEGFRPGVMERLGIGPDECLPRNPRLVFARVTGWGQDGPLAQTAGHDLNYIGLTGVLGALGPRDRPPPPPLALVGDYGGGSMYVLLGVLAALVERGVSGRGQVVDAAMVNGVSLLSQLMWSLRSDGAWQDTRHSNFLDGAAPYYRTYECSDGRYLAVAPLEQKFYDVLLTGLGLAPGDLPDRGDPANWPVIEQRLDSIFRTRSRDAWAEHFAGSDACVSPVLTWDEASTDPQLRHREALVTIEGRLQAGIGPLFSRTRPGVPSAPRQLGEDGPEVFRDWGV